MCQRVLVNKVSGIRPATLLKKLSNTEVFLEFGEISKNTSFHRTFPVAASDSTAG